MGKGGKLGHVPDAGGEGDDGGPASKQGQKPLRRLLASVVCIEGEEDAGAAPEGVGDPLNALGAQGCTGGEVPGGKSDPVEDALGDDRPQRGAAKTPQAQHRLGTGQRLEPGRPVGVYGPAHEPADEAAGDVGNDDRAGEPLRPPRHEQPGVPETLLREALGLQGLPQPAARRIAEAPRGQVLPRFCVTPELPGVEARHRRQQVGVAGWQRRGLRRLPRSGWTAAPGLRPGPPTVQPGDGLRHRQALGPLDEVQHVTSLTAAEAVEPLRVAVHREAALGLVVERADALADPSTTAQPHPGGFHRVAQGVPGLQRGDVHVDRDHHAPPFRGRRPRRLRRETTLPGRQRIPRTATTSSDPPSL